MGKDLPSELLEAFSTQLLSFQQTHPVKAWYVALSGGLDSRVLLDLLIQAQVIEHFPLPIRVIHVHHGVSKNADEWMGFCETLCNHYDAKFSGLDIGFQAYQVEVSAKGSFEEQARQSRYQIFESVLGQGDVLLMAHHLNDQAETFLQRLMRGAGIQGLSSIPKRRALGNGYLFRPLLAQTLQTLLDYADQSSLKWVEDESNQSLTYDRNFLRHEILPSLIQRWPKALTSISRTLDIVSQEHQSLSYFRDQWLSANDSEVSLNLVQLNTLPQPEQVGVLSHWVRKQSGYSLTHKQLNTLLSEVVQAQADAQPVLLIGNVEYRRFQQRLYVVAKFDKATLTDWSERLALIPGQVHKVILPTGAELLFTPELGGLALPEDSIEIRFRQGGESFKPEGDNHTRELKKWLQGQNIPPWQRSEIPLLYSNQRLLAVADLAGDNCVKGCATEVGWKVTWKR